MFAEVRYKPDNRFRLAFDNFGWNDYNAGFQFTKRKSISLTSEKNNNRFRRLFLRVFVILALSSNNIVDFDNLVKLCIS